MKPVEGTILTVAKDAAQAAIEKANNTEDRIELMEEHYWEKPMNHLKKHQTY